MGCKKSKFIKTKGREEPSPFPQLEAPGTYAYCLHSQARHLNLNRLFREVFGDIENTLSIAKYSFPDIVIQAAPVKQSTKKINYK